MDTISRMGGKLQKLKAVLLELPTPLLIGLGLLLLFVATLPSVVSVLLYPDSQIGGPDWNKKQIWRVILWGCLLGPLLETAVHQWACLRVLEKFGVKAMLAIALSSFGFGVAHYYSAHTCSRRSSAASFSRRCLS
ncbi:CAAX prenyl protease-like protein [Paraburkholderia sp. GV068]|uniref:CPBP family glutamic-type intramembrane protease n=1 Tax=Paraburkholderia TaxID=1822464 RepID=UPI000D30E496|nr:MULTISPECIES: CPBP family glutamic-type intramembrane protease [unclassified Paraburkholderia]PTQ99171.1 CAAX prenyl protease-like protein [Paraburkholderia sp. GV072]PUB04662.1 CAAX prenyl protease-like protein [Paraburkholderia sp. GV068]